jgi:hypothetical protein
VSRKRKGAPQYPQRDMVSRRRRPAGVQPTPEQMKAWREQAVKDLAAGRCPDFSLAPLKEYPRELLVPEPGAEEKGDRERLKRLALTLALAFNDAKDLSWFFCQLSYGQPQEKKVSPYVGQWYGMRGFVLRTLIGFVGELVRALEKNRDLLSSSECKAAVDRVPSEYRWAWDGLLEMLGDDAETRAPVVKLVVRLRSRLAFHYAADDPRDDNMCRLAKAYEEKFRNPVDETGKAAYASLGDRMEASRFYFADAPVLVVIEQEMKNAGVPKVEDVFEFFRQVNYALRFVVEGLMDHLVATSTPPHGASAPEPVACPPTAA